MAFQRGWNDDGSQYKDSSGNPNTPRGVRSDTPSERLFGSDAAPNKREEKELQMGPRGTM